MKCIFVLLTCNQVGEKDEFTVRRLRSTHFIRLIGANWFVLPCVRRAAGTLSSFSFVLHDRTGVRVIWHYFSPPNGPVHLLRLAVNLIVKEFTRKKAR